MNYRNCRRWGEFVLIAFSCVYLGRPVGAASVTTDPPPVEGGLFIELNGETLTTAGLLGIWQDQRNDGNSGSFQNFVQGEAFRQPSAVLNHVMPNSLEANVVNFARGPYGTDQNSNNNNNSTRTDFLRSVAGGVDGSTVIGADPVSYDLNKLTYFVVFQLNLANTNIDRRPQQLIFGSNYTDVSSTYATVTHGAGYDNSGTGTTFVAGGQPDLYSAVRGNPGATELGAGVADVPVGRWYIAATSWDTDSGNTRLVFYDEQGTVTELSLNTGSFGDGLDGHQNTSLGAGTNTGSSGTRMQGLEGNIAELLMYNTALSVSATNRVINYLNNKYFGASTVLPVPPVAGDYNGNGAVDAADYVLWRKGDPAADGVDDDVIDQLDYDFWRARFGNTSGIGSFAGLEGTSVPEPAAVLLAITCSLLFFGRQRAARLVCTETSR